MTEYDQSLITPSWTVPRPRLCGAAHYNLTIIDSAHHYKISRFKMRSKI